VIDLFARKVVGWSMKPILSRELALDALMMAVWQRFCRAIASITLKCSTTGPGVSPLTVG
jgi:transposase InsO family protein